VSREHFVVRADDGKVGLFFCVQNQFIFYRSRGHSVGNVSAGQTTSVSALAAEFVNAIQIATTRLYAAPGNAFSYRQNG